MRTLKAPIIPMLVGTFTRRATTTTIMVTGITTTITIMARWGCSIAPPVRPDSGSRG